MAGRLSDRLARRAADGFVGRSAELALLERALAWDGPPVVYLHGIAGIGKSRLLATFAERARRSGAAVVPLDGRAVEPTERGFLRELGDALGDDLATADAAAKRLGALGDRVVITLDTYELLRLLDTWLRQTFLPTLPVNVRVVLASRERPAPAWLTAAGWQGLFRAVELQPLEGHDAEALLARAGVATADARRINRFARGHPLALTLAAASRGDAHGPDLEPGGGQRVVEELTRLYLADVRSPVTREALEAVSVVRRGTLSLLRAMLPRAAPADAFERLQALPFVETSRDGLRIHDAVQQAIAATVRAAEPDRYARYRRLAWQQLRSESRGAGGPELWRYTADLLYLVENPSVREAFFPSDAQLFAVEPARPDDGPAIRTICARHEGEQEASALASWLTHQPDAVFAVRDREDRVAGFYSMVDLGTLRAGIVRDDPIAAAWARHLRRNPLPAGQRALVLRRWLSLEHGESPSAVQAACWLDAKRAYMELRPALQRVYTTVRDLSAYAPTIRRLGFKVVPECEVELDGQTYVTGALDFGPGSVDGWLAGLVAAELGLTEDPGLLDLDSRELVLGERRVGLTRLEFAVMRYLLDHAGKAVTRAALLENIWGYGEGGGSNVVDVVVRGLRKKLDDQARVIETVSGIGYRLRPPA